MYTYIYIYIYICILHTCFRRITCCFAGSCALNIVMIWGILKGFSMKPTESFKFVGFVFHAGSGCMTSGPQRKSGLEPEVCRTNSLSEVRDRWISPSKVAIVRWCPRLPLKRPLLEVPKRDMGEFAMVHPANNKKQTVVNQHLNEEKLKMGMGLSFFQWSPPASGARPLKQDSNGGLPIAPSLGSKRAHV